MYYDKFYTFHGKFGISRAGEYTQKFSLIDTKTGRIICSETINLFGF